MVNWKIWKSGGEPTNESSPLLDNQQSEPSSSSSSQPIPTSSQSQPQQNIVPLSTSSSVLRNRQNHSEYIVDNGPLSQSVDNISTVKHQGPLIEETPLTFSSFIDKLNKKNTTINSSQDYPKPLSQSQQQQQQQQSFEQLHQHHQYQQQQQQQQQPLYYQNQPASPSSFSSSSSPEQFSFNDYKSGKNNKPFSEIFKEKLKLIKKRTPYYIPILSWLPQYTKANLIGDVTAGITTSIMLVPQSLAYALLVGLPPIYGLYTGLMPLLIYAIFGTSRQLSVGPEALVSLIVGTTLSTISENADIPLTPDELIYCANILAFLVGIVSLILGLLRFGFLSEVLSRPLIRGFINAVAFTILFDQMDTLLGVSVSESGWRKLPEVIKNWSQVNLLSSLISLFSIILLLIMGQIKKRFCPEIRTKIIHHIIFFIPSILVVVVIGISVSAGFKLSEKGIKCLGYYDTSFPVPVLPKLNRWELVNQLISPALFISIVGFVESMAVSKNFATKHNYQVSTNRELVAIGASNIFGSFFLAYPIYASMTRSAVNDKAGAKTQLAGFFTFIVVLFTLLFLMPVFQYLPRVIMSSIIFVAALGLLELHDILFLWKLRAWVDLLLFLATFICTFVFSVEVGLMVSIGASILLVIRQSSAPHFTVLGRLPDQPNKYKDIIIFPDAKQVDGILIIRFDESLYFANISSVKEILFRIENMGNALAHPSEALPQDQRSPLLGIIFDMRNIPVIDASSTQILYEMVQQYLKRNVKICFVKLRDSQKKNFIRAGFIDLIGTDSFFSSTHDAVNKLTQNFKSSNLSYSYSSYNNNNNNLNNLYYNSNNSSLNNSLKNSDTIILNNNINNNNNNNDNNIDYFNIDNSDNNSENNSNGNIIDNNNNNNNNDENNNNSNIIDGNSNNTYNDL